MSQYSINTKVEYSNYARVILDSDNLAPPRNIFQISLAHLNHFWKCTNDFLNLQHRIEGNKDVIYADKTCVVCGRIENVLVFSKVRIDDIDFLLCSSEIIK